MVDGNKEGEAIRDLRPAFRISLDHVTSAYLTWHSAIASQDAEEKVQTEHN